VPEHKVLKVNLSTEIAIKAIVSAGMVSSAKSDMMSSPERSLADVIRRWKAQKKNLVFDPRD